MPTRRIAQIALKKHGSTNVWHFDTAFAALSMSVADEAEVDILANLTVDDDKFSNGTYTGDKLFMKNLTFQLNLTCDNVTHAQHDANQGEFRKPLRITLCIVQTNMSPSLNKTFNLGSIVEDRDKMLISRYLPKTAGLYIGPYKVLWRKEVTLISYAQDSSFFAADTYFIPSIFPGHVPGTSQVIVKGAIKLNTLVRCMAANEKTHGLKMFAQACAGPYGSTLWSGDVTGNIRIYYTSGG